MKDQWFIPENDVFVGNKKALKNKISKESGLFSKYAEIWEFSNNKIGVLIKSRCLAKKLFGTTSSFGDELLFIRPISELNKLCKVLKVPKSLKSQKRHTEN